METAFYLLPMWGGEIRQISKMYYLKKISSLGLMGKARFTDKVRERLVIIHNADIIKNHTNFI